MKTLIYVCLLLVQTSNVSHKKINNDDVIIHLYPNIHIIFKLLIVFPVTSVCCQCSLSALRILKTCAWSTMTGERLCGLAMLHSHRNMAVNREKCLRWYDASGNRKLGRFFYGQLRHAQILIFLLQSHKKSLFRTLIFNIHHSPVHDDACIKLNTKCKLIDYKIIHFFH